jgi:hypothetical protein
MKKLLLVMLVPLIVLGIIACSNTNVTGTDVDAFVQGAWVLQPTWFFVEGTPDGRIAIPTPMYPGLSASAPVGGYELAISGGQMTVRSGYTNVTYPFRVEFDYLFNTDGDRFIAFEDINSTPAAADFLSAIGWNGTMAQAQAWLDTLAATPVGIFLPTAKGDPKNIIAGQITMYAYADDVEIAELTLLASQTVYGERQLVIGGVNLLVDEEDYWYYDPHSIPLPGVYKNYYTATPAP